MNLANQEELTNKIASCLAEIETQVMPMSERADKLTNFREKVLRYVGIFYLNVFNLKI